ncbi:MAG: hypothetical protein K8R99_12720 [Actinomycetia bacterium]|nr:hypothetical protein [Actinomycetes bacterium]
MKLRYLSLGAVALGFVIGGSASHANADVPGGSGCEGSAVWLEDGLTIVAETDGGPYTIPRSDTVRWEGSVTDAPGVYSGSVTVELPPPFGEVEIDSWSGDSESTSNSGEHEYDFPSLVPAGVEFSVNGEHIDENGGCSGTIAFEIDGGPFDSPIAPISLGGTALFAILTGLALKPLFMKVI